MRKLLLIAGVCLATISTGSFGTLAADRAVPGVRHTNAGCQVCGPNGCFWQSVCRPVVICPSRYSCGPLYGAYGPWGGESYWGAYTFAGWGNRW